MAVKHVRPHLQRMARAHKSHFKHFLRIAHAIRSHPGAYQPGFRPSRAAMPKSWPAKPRGLHKEASGFWDFAKKGWNWVKSKFHQHKGKVMDQAKKVGKRVGKRVYDSGARVGGRVLDRVTEIAENNLEHYVQKAESKIEAVGKKAEAKISKWDKKTSSGMPGKTVAKKGSGYGLDMVRRMQRQPRNKLIRDALRASAAGRGRGPRRVSDIRSLVMGQAPRRRGRPRGLLGYQLTPGAK